MDLTTMKKISESDIIITFRSSEDGLVSPLCCVYVRTGKSYRQIGLIQDLQVTSCCKKYLAEMTIGLTKPVKGMSDHLLQALMKYTKLLRKFKNIKVK